MLLSKAFNDKLPRLLRFPSPPTSPPLPIIYYITSVHAPGNAEPGSHPPTKASPSIDYDEQGFPPPLTPSPPPGSALLGGAGGTEGGKMRGTKGRLSLTFP